MSNYDLSEREQGTAIAVGMDFDLSETDALILKLFTAVAEYHVGLQTIQTFEETYERDKQLISLTHQYFRERKLSTSKA